MYTTKIEREYACGRVSGRLKEVKKQKTKQNKEVSWYHIFEIDSFSYPIILRTKRQTLLWPFF